MNDKILNSEQNNMDVTDNEQISLNSISYELSKLLADVWSKSSQAGLSISENDLDMLNNSKELAINLVSANFDRIIDIANNRRANLRAERNMQFISLGEDCFCRTILTRWGLINPAKLGGKSGPFDLAIHPLKTINQLLATDFHDYLEPTLLEYNSEQKICVNNKLEVQFNHETGESYSNNSFVDLINVYTKRIERLRKLLNGKENIVFVLHLRKPIESDVNFIIEIVNTLQNTYAALNWRMVCICTWQYNQLHTDINKNFDLPKSVSFINISYPFSGYVWYNKAHASLEAGYNFEKSIIFSLLKLITSTQTTSEQVI